MTARKGHVIRREPDGTGAVFRWTLLSPYRVRVDVYEVFGETTTGSPIYRGYEAYTTFLEMAIPVARVEGDEDMMSFSFPETARAGRKPKFVTGYGATYLGAVLEGAESLGIAILANQVRRVEGAEVQL